MTEEIESHSYPSQNASGVSSDITRAYHRLNTNVLMISDALIVFSEAIKVLDFHLSYNVRDMDESFVMRKKDWFEHVFKNLAATQEGKMQMVNVSDEQRLALYYAFQELFDYSEDINSAYIRVQKALSVM